MATYVFRDSGLVDKATGERLPFDPNAPVTTPMIMKDVPPHFDPGGNLVTSRSQMREAMKKYDCVQADPGLKGRPRGFMNQEIARNFGKTVNPETIEKFKQDRREAYRAADIEHALDAKIEKKREARARKRKETQ